MVTGKEINITELAQEIKRIELSKEEKQLNDVIFQLKSKRKEKKLTQQQLADMCNVPRSTIARTEAYISTPTMPILLKMINALDLSLTINDL